MNNKKILIFGGSGSLGNTLIQKYLGNNKIFNFSRDECKHWKMELKYRSNNLHNIIGNINDYHRVEETLLRVHPNVIIIAAALKHIDKCEFASSESLATNLLGVKNILDAVEKKQNELHNLEVVLFVSTDKACSPINIYGMCKALAEKLVIEKSYYLNKFKFICVRYGNVLNSRGSIIPILHKTGLNPNIEDFTLTDTRMTRFIMMLSDACDLIEHAICNASSGDVVIPKLNSMYIKDLFEIFSEKYNKPIKIIGLRVGEKIHESLINETQSARVLETEKYYYIKSNYTTKNINEKLFDYNSGQRLLSSDELKIFLEKNNFM